MLLRLNQGDRIPYLEFNDSICVMVIPISFLDS